MFKPFIKPNIILLQHPQGSSLLVNTKVGYPVCCCFILECPFSYRSRQRRPKTLYYTMYKTALGSLNRPGPGSCESWYNLQLSYIPIALPVVTLLPSYRCRESNPGTAYVHCHVLGVQEKLGGAGRNCLQRRVIMYWWASFQAENVAVVRSREVATKQGFCKYHSDSDAIRTKVSVRCKRSGSTAGVVINRQCACAARVTVLGLSACLSVCLSIT